MKFDKKTIPGIIATGLMIIITTFWSYWSFAEMYHEGWWGPFYIRLAYLLPGVICLLMTLIGITWPKVGGWLIIIIGGAFTVFFLDISIIDGKLSFDRDIFGFLISAPFVLIGCLFIFDGKNQAKRLDSGWVPSSKWWKRNIRFILTISPVIRLLTEAQYIWRMPSVDEYLRSFSRHNVNAGCFWNGDTGSQMNCEILPDKETPLWALDIEPIYYWAFEEFNDREASFVSYNGWVNATYKPGGNPRHSYRCVRDVIRF